MTFLEESPVHTESRAATASGSPWWFLTLLVIGLVERFLDPPAGVRPQLFVLQREGFIQIGAVGFFYTVLLSVARRRSAEAAKRLHDRTRAAVPKAVFALGVFFVAGEVALRIYFWDGQSFGTHYGPIVHRFERTFQLNDLDSSRGPHVEGPKRPGTLRLLVQGDSVTWGQGVRNEQDLYTNQLLELLRAGNAAIELAVLAQPGREIDGHLASLDLYGPSLGPDVILYQWLVNDMEIDTKPHRPQQPYCIWRSFFLHRALSLTSYYWFFLDYKIASLLPGSPTTYTDYILNYFSGNTQAWNHFAETFRRWCLEAKQLTPRVLVFLYPDLSNPEQHRLAIIHAQMLRLCRDLGVEAVDLSKDLEDLQGRTDVIAATEYDGHPNAYVHGRIAKVLHKVLDQRWPDLFASGSMSTPDWERQPDPLKQPRGVDGPVLEEQGGTDIRPLSDNVRHLKTTN